MSKDKEHKIEIRTTNKEKGQRILVFSPHPDDDVIAMGGTIYHLAREGQVVHVAYQTSGNIAVSDEDIIDYVKRHSDEKLSSSDKLRIGGLVRREEALAACSCNGIPERQVHFLNLPFYETGRVEKLPVGEKDIRIIRQLLHQVKPQQIYVAGDFADPHGTHRKCTEAVFSAFSQEKEAGEEWVMDCRIWMYNGAWDEWQVEDIDLCVPLTHDELMAKRHAIQQHHSQMENAPYKGNDARLFWQRSEDRNRRTAELLHQLGYPKYEALEAFVEYKP